MPCYTPLQAFRSEKRNSVTSKFVLSFKELPDFREIQLPCGQCVGCRLERSRQWAVRCMHEASMYDSNVFITLTFNDVNCPVSLDVSVFQKFMKRLRKRLGSGIRFYHCGEYGEKFGRPHYHAILFNCDFPDKRVFKAQGEHVLFRSQILEELWPFGYSSIGSVTFDSAAYVARYVMKKITGKRADLSYEIGVDFDTGEVLTKKPEYNTMSRRPGIGRKWLDLYLSEVYPCDFVVMNGRKMRPPKYYDSQFEVLFPSDYADIKEERAVNALEFKADNTADRLDVRHQVQLGKLRSLVRPLE